MIRWTVIKCLSFKFNFFMKLSIIIPVYNVEKTFRRCIDSVLSQGIDNYEILIIDDGSTDNSGNLADKAASLNNNIKVFS